MAPRIAPPRRRSRAIEDIEGRSGGMRARLFCAVAAVAAAALGFSCVPVRADEPAASPPPPLPQHKLPPSADGNLVVGLCDGETSVEVPGVRPGEALTPEQGRQVAEALMREWRRKHQGARGD